MIASAGSETFIPICQNVEYRQCGKVIFCALQSREWHPSFDVEGQATRERLLVALAAAHAAAPPQLQPTPPSDARAAHASEAHGGPAGLSLATQILRMRRGNCALFISVATSSYVFTAPYPLPTCHQRGGRDMQLVSVQVWCRTSVSKRWPSGEGDTKCRGSRRATQVPPMTACSTCGRTSDTALHGRRRCARPGPPPLPLAPPARAPPAVHMPRPAPGPRGAVEARGKRQG